MTILEPVSIWNLREWRFFTIAELVKPKPEASHVFFKSYDGYSTNNPLEVCMDDDVLIAQHSGTASR